MVAEGVDALPGLLGLEGFDPLVGIGIAMIVILLLVLIVPIIKIVLDMAPYAYPNARVRGMESRLLHLSRLEELADASSLQDVSNMLEGTGYEMHLGRSQGVDYSAQLEAALMSSLRQDYSSVIKMAPEEVQPVLKTRLRFLDVEIIKKALRAVHAGVSLEKELEGVSATGQLTQDIINSLKDAQNMDDLITKLEGTEYGPILREAMAEYTQNKNFRVPEDALNRYVYERLWESAKVVSGTNSKILKMFFGTEIDLMNLRMLVRGKYDNLGESDLKSWILPMRYALSEGIIDDLINSADLRGMASVLESTPYGEIMADLIQANGNGGTSLIPFEIAVDSYFMSVSRSISGSQPFGIGPMVGYLASKEIEVRNLRSIVKGVDESIEPDRIKQTLAGVSGV